MDKKLNELFEFLDTNRAYNHSLQDRYYKSVILPFETSKDKVISLLYHIVNTQSQPKIDKLAVFFKSIIPDNDCFESFSNFIFKINSDRQVICCFESLFNGMQRQSGWGNKTSALFAKIIYHLHNGQYSKELKIWNDVPNIITNQDKFFLPVDTVITRIFKELDNNINWNFNNINAILESNYNGQQIEVWDDLWFWGFITQNGSGNDRLLKWNENKYWTLKEGDKNSKMINEIKQKSVEFLRIIMKDS
jgi:hypothetical protein